MGWAKKWACSPGEVNKRPFDQDFHDKALLIFSRRICSSGESLPFYWHYSNDASQKKRSQFRSMPSLDDRVGESPNEINAEAWLPFLLYILSPDNTLCTTYPMRYFRRAGCQVSASLRALHFSTERNMENFQDDNIKFAMRQRAQIFAY